MKYRRNWAEDEAEPGSSVYTKMAVSVGHVTLDNATAYPIGQQINQFSISNTNAGKSRVWVYFILQLYMYILTCILKNDRFK